MNIVITITDLLLAKEAASTPLHTAGVIEIARRVTNIFKVTRYSFYTETESTLEMHQ